MRLVHFSTKERKVIKQTKRFYFSLTAFIFFVVANGLGATTQLDIPIRAAGYGTAFYEETARLYEKTHPDIKINIYGSPRIDDQISVQIMDGKLPDAASAPYVLWPQLIRSGQVLDLTPYLKQKNWEGDEVWENTFFPGTLDVWRVDNRVGGLPVSMACWTIFYNKALFREHNWEPAKTWDEFYVLCDKIKAAGVAPISIPGVSWLYADAFFRYAYYNLVGAQGWKEMLDLKPGARTASPYIRAAEVEQTVISRYAMRGWQGETHTGAEQSFLLGRSAMTVSGSWLVNEMEGKLSNTFELGIMNFPLFKDGVTDPSAVHIGSDCFFVFNTGNPDRVQKTIEFLKFLTSKERATAFVREMNSPVSVKGVALSSYSQRMQETATLILNAKEAFAMPSTMMLSAEVRQVIVDLNSKLGSQTITPEQYGASLEAAASIDRNVKANPTHIEYRHTSLGVLLITVVGIIVSGLLMLTVSKKFKQTAQNETQKQDAYFNALNTKAGLFFIGPAFLVYAIFLLIPALISFSWSFTRWSGVGAKTFVGLFNFKWLLFESDTFWLALKNNGFLMVVPFVVVVPLALGCAALLHYGVYGKSFFRTVFLFPNLLGGIAASLLWLTAYQPHGGLVNATLVALGKLIHSKTLTDFDGFPWLAPQYLYTSLIPIYIWMACGFNLILYLAAMEGIDGQLYEAAELEGVSKVKQFFSITLPLIKEVIIISVIFLVIGGLNAFEMVWLLTSQAPGASSHTLGTFLVSSMFNDFEIGRASALAVILFILVASVSALVMRSFKRSNNDA